MVLLPGVPAELQAIFETEVKPRLARCAGRLRLFTRELRITGLPESEVETRVSPLYALYPDTETTILASPPGIQLHPSVWSDDAASAEKLLDEIVDRMALALGEHLFTTHGETLEEVVGRMLTENRATIAVAESCTGGQLAERLTSVPGSSIYFLGGVVCYSNDLKDPLGGRAGDDDRVKRRGKPRSGDGLAEGIRKRTGATIGIGVTGIAGPWRRLAGKAGGLGLHRYRR